MLTERLPLYQRLAAVTVETDDLDPDEIAAQIAATVTAGPSQSPEPLQSPPEDSR
jgi:hypothetical protein